MTNNDDDNWLNSAFNDAGFAAHVLLKLSQPSPPSALLNQPPKTWTIRQRRSRPPPPLPPTAANKPSATRASPTTPLSWSGATSVSGGGGVEESSRLVLHDGSDISRSKAIRANETTPTKRPRKKKTLAELKEDETTLLEERKQLKRQLAALQATCEKHRKDNESLKKMKNDLKSQQVLAVTEEQKNNDSFVLPDLNIPADGDC